MKHIILTLTAIVALASNTFGAQLATLDFETATEEQALGWWSNGASDYTDHFTIVSESQMGSYPLMSCRSGTKCLRMNFAESHGGTDPLTGKTKNDNPLCELFGPTGARIADQSTVTIDFWVRFDRVNHGTQILNKLAFITITPTGACLGSTHGGYLGGVLSNITPCNSPSSSCCSHSWTQANWGNSLKGYFQNYSALGGNGNWVRVGIFINQTEKYYQFYQNGTRLKIDPTKCGAPGLDCVNDRFYWSLPGSPNGDLANAVVRGLQIPFAGVDEEDDTLAGVTNPEVVGGMMFDDISIHSGNLYDAGADNAAPTCSTFAVQATSQSLTVPITSWDCTDNTGVTGWYLSETPNAPGSTGWLSSKPTSFVVGGTGTRTIYAWVRDAADNRSAGRSSTTVVTEDQAPPAPGSTKMGISGKTRFSPVGLGVLRFQ